MLETTKVSLNPTARMVEENSEQLSQLQPSSVSILDTNASTVSQYVRPSLLYNPRSAKFLGHGLRTDLNKGGDLTKLKNSQLYGKYVPRSPAMDAIRNTIKARRLVQIEQTILLRCDSVQMVLENICDPQYGADILQLCDSFGIHNVHAIESIVPFGYRPMVGNNKSVSAPERFLNLTYYESMQEFLSRNSLEDKRESRMFVLLENIPTERLDPESKPFEDVDWKNLMEDHHVSTLFLIAANPSRKLSHKLRGLASLRVHTCSSVGVHEFTPSVSLAMMLAHMRMEQVFQPDFCTRNPALATQNYEKFVVRLSQSTPKISKSFGAFGYY